MRSTAPYVAIPRCVCCALTVVLLALPHAAGLPQASAADRPDAADPDANDVLRGLKEGRLQLRRGVFRAHGRIEDEYQDPPLYGDVRVFCAFDFDRRLLRFDRTEPGESPFVRDNPPIVPVTGKYIRSPIGTVHGVGGRVFAGRVNEGRVRVGLS